MRSAEPRHRLRMTIGIAGASIVLWTVFAFLIVPTLIRLTYITEAIPVLGRLLSGREIHDLEHYLAAWRSLAALPTALVVVFAALAVVLALPPVESFFARAFGIPDPVRIRACLSLPRIVVIHGIILSVAGGSAFHVIADEERWPFSNYPMYSDLARPEVVLVRLYGVGGTREIPLNQSSYLWPFDQLRLTAALRKITRNEKYNQAGFQTALSYVLRRYEALRSAGEHEGPPLCGLRLYELRWAVRSMARNAATPDERRTLWEKLDCPADAEQ